MKKNWQLQLVAALAIVAFVSVSAQAKCLTGNCKGAGDDVKAPVVASNDCCASNAGYQVTSIAYPTGKVSTSSLYLEKKTPKVVRLGQAYSYCITVKNLTNLDLQGVKVFEVIPAGFKLMSAEPNFTSQNGQNVTWDIGTMAPGEQRNICLKGEANRKEDLPCCTSAEFANPALCQETMVIQPALALSLTAPAQKLVCDKIPLQFTVTNTGDSAVQDVTITSDFPAGVTLDGKTQLVAKVSGLAVGQSKTVTTEVKADNVGTYTFNGAASSPDASATAANQSTTVVQPKLAIKASVDRDQQYVGRDITYNVVVSNVSDIPAESAIVQAALSDAVKVQSASDSGDASGRAVRWNLGTLQPNQAKQLTVNAVGVNAGTATLEAVAMADCCSKADAAVSNNLNGIPALLLEVVDILDPIEVGGKETYVISVTNQGSAVGTNIKIVATVEDMDFVSSSGATDGSASGSTYTFTPLPRLDAKDTAVWKLNVTGQKAGDTRFKVQMTADQLTRPVEETESTFVY